MSASRVGLGRAASNPQQLASKIIQRPALLAGALAGLKSETARTRFACAKALELVSEQRPGLLYPYFDFFVSLLSNENKIFQWEAAKILAQLTRVDAQNKFSAIFERYFAAITGPHMITAATAIRGGAAIAKAQPQLADRIAREIIKVEHARYQSSECRNVALGHAFAALDDFFELVKAPQLMLGFARRQLDNSRAATRKKAAAFLKRHEGRQLQPSPRAPTKAVLSLLAS